MNHTFGVAIALEQVFLDHDSEDEVADDIADLEGRRVTFLRVADD
jgi:hypothetical protein